MTVSSIPMQEDLAGEKRPIVAEIFVSSYRLYWNPVSFLITNSIGDIDLSCFGSAVIVAILFVSVWVSPGIGVDGVFVVPAALPSWLTVEITEEPRMLWMALMLKSDRGSKK